MVTHLQVLLLEQDFETTGDTLDTQDARALVTQAQVVAF